MPYTDENGQPIDPEDPRYGPDPNTGSGDANFPSGPPDPNNPAPPTVPPPNNTPAPNSQDLSGEVTAEYQKALGRAPTASELASELDNLTRYGFDTGPYGGVKAQIDKRATNIPGGGGAPLSAAGNGAGNGSGNGSGGNVGFGASSGMADPGNFFASMPTYQPFTDQFTPPTMTDASGAAYDPQQTFTAPTEQQMIAGDPGYQARMDAATQAMQRSAASRGTLLTGGTEKALGQAMQDYASNEYGNYYGQSANTYGENQNAYAQNYNHAMQQYMTKFNTNQSNQLNSLNTNRNNMLDTFGMSTTNRQLSDSENAQAFNQYATLNGQYLNAMLGLGGQGLSGASALSGLGSQVSDYLSQLGNVTAGGIVGSQNAWNSGLGNLANSSWLPYIYGQQRTSTTG